MHVKLGEILVEGSSDKLQTFRIRTYPKLDTLTLILYPGMSFLQALHIDRMHFQYKITHSGGWTGIVQDLTPLPCRVTNTTGESGWASLVCVDTLRA